MGCVCSSGGFKTLVANFLTSFNNYYKKHNYKRNILFFLQQNEYST